MNRFFLSALVAVAVVLTTGCASSSQTKPTHYWDAAAKPETTYQSDNSACESANGAEASNPMLAESGAFQLYKDCMVERGYVLRTY